MRGFSFLLSKLVYLTKKLFQPTPNLLNTNSGTEEKSTVPTQYSFYPGQQQIVENIESFSKVPQKYFINESCFLYDKSDLIKETYITTLNKKISIYGSISYFNIKRK